MNELKFSINPTPFDPRWLDRMLRTRTSCILDYGRASPEQRQRARALCETIFGRYPEYAGQLTLLRFIEDLFDYALLVQFEDDGGFELFSTSLSDWPASYREDPDEAVYQAPVMTLAELLQEYGA